MSLDISVIVPTFRRPAQLTEAVRSALAEHGVGELLILDDSPEGSAREAALAIGDPRVSYHKRETPSGGNPAVVRNQGWPLAKGRFVVFLDDDDRVAPGGYDALAEALAKDPKAAMAFGRVEPFGTQGAQLAHEIAFFLDAAHRARNAQWSRSPASLTREMLFGAALFVTSAAMFRKEHLEALDGLDTATEMMDSTDFAVRAAARYTRVFVDRIVAQYRYDQHSLIHDAKSAERLRTAYRRMHATYKARRGALRFWLLKAYDRSVKRWW